MRAAEYNLAAEQGATWRLPLAYRPAGGARVPLAGVPVRAQVRRGSPAYPGAVVFDFAAAGALDRTQEAAGVVALTLTAAQAAALPAGTHCYDVFLDFAGVSVRVLAGFFEVAPRVTRP